MGVIRRKAPHSWTCTAELPAQPVPLPPVHPYGNGRALRSASVTDPSSPTWSFSTSSLVTKLKLLCPMDLRKTVCLPGLDGILLPERMRITVILVGIFVRLPRIACNH